MEPQSIAVCSQKNPRASHEIDKYEKSAEALVMWDTNDLVPFALINFSLRIYETSLRDFVCIMFRDVMRILERNEYCKQDVL